MNLFGLAILLSAEKNVLISKSKKAKPVDFYKFYLQGNKSTQAHKSIDNVLLNADALGLIEGYEWLEQAKNFYNGYSHASIMTMGSLMLPSGKPIIAGGFYKEKLDLYKDHLKFILRFAKHLPKLLEVVALRSLTSVLNEKKQLVRFRFATHYNKNELFYRLVSCPMPLAENSAFGVKLALFEWFHHRPNKKQSLILLE